MSVAWVPRIGAEFGGYRLESLIGHGGMSIVYRAEHLSLERTVALKLLAPQLSEDEAFRERFLRESRLAASLDHPNVIPIYEAGEEEGVFFIAMRFVDGLDLKTLLKREGALPLDRTSSIISQVSSALGAAHAKGLVHRDVKPANILLAAGYSDDGVSDHAYLSDFGVVKHGASRPLTQTGMFVGTAEYASPEQIEGKELDGRADVYALGCVLYECLTGMPAYDKDSEVALMYAHLLEPPPTVSPKRPDLPPQVDDVVAMGMAKQRDQRYGTPRELAAALRDLAGTSARPVTSAGPTQLSTPETALGAGAGAAAAAGAEAAPSAAGVAPAAASATPQSTASAPPPEAPPAPAAPPTGPPERPGLSRNAKILAAVGAVVLLGAIAAIAAILLTGGDDDGGGTSTGAADSLIEVLAPTSISNSCSQVEPPAQGAVQTNTCPAPAGANAKVPDDLELSFYAGGKSDGPGQALESAYNDAKSGITIGKCGDGAGEQEWKHEYKSPPGVGGRRFCYSAGNQTVIVWTHEQRGDIATHFDMLGIAKEAGRAGSVFDWWDTPVGDGKKVHDVIGVCRSGGDAAACANTIKKFS